VKPPAGTAKKSSSARTPDKGVHLQSKEEIASRKPRISKKLETLENLTRLWISCAVFVLLALAYIRALIWRPDNCKEVLIVISSGLSYLLGKGQRR
jgi:hypothetical protein